MRLPTLILAFAACAAAQPCTIFFVKRDGKVLMGANEDMERKAPWDKHWVRVVPAKEKDKLGYVAFGYNAAPLVAQAAMNEAGLFYDYNALPVLEEGPKDSPKGSLLVVYDVLQQCGTVAEAVAMLEKYDMVGFSSGQMVIGDAKGESAIIERNAITYRGRADYQVGTNFRTSTTKKDQITCWRWKKCDEILGQAKPVSIESVRALCESTMPGIESHISWWTTVCDLQAAKILLFRKGDFSKAATIDVKELVKKGDKAQDMDEFMAANAQAYRP